MNKQILLQGQGLFILCLYISGQRYGHVHIRFDSLVFMLYVRRIRTPVCLIVTKGPLICERVFFSGFFFVRVCVLGVTLSNLRNSHVVLSIIRNCHVILSNLGNSHRLYVTVSVSPQKSLCRHVDFEDQGPHRQDTYWEICFSITCTNIVQRIVTRKLSYKLI